MTVVVEIELEFFVGIVSLVQSDCDHISGPRVRQHAGGPDDRVDRHIGEEIDLGGGNAVGGRSRYHFDAAVNDIGGVVDTDKDVIEFDIVIGLSHSA